MPAADEAVTGEEMELAALTVGVTNKLTLAFRVVGAAPPPAVSDSESNRVGGVVVVACVGCVGLAVEVADVWVERSGSATTFVGANGLVADSVLTIDIY